jgi:DNA-directed RNA polymerase specialized sigma24 family protein
VIPAEKITETSWRELMRAVRSYVGRRVNNPDDRDDLVQDVLLRIHRGLPSLRAQTSPGPWIYGIARNAVVDHGARKDTGSPFPSIRLKSPSANCVLRPTVAICCSKRLRRISLVW